MAKHLISKQGYTLAELLIVVLIIVLLALLATPQYSERPPILNPIPFTSTLLVDGIKKELDIGTVAIGHPQEIKNEESKEVIVTLDLHKKQNELFSQLPIDYKKYGAEVKVSNLMKTDLTSQYFEIVQETPEVQAIASDSTAKWSWSIKPKPDSEGFCKLSITLSALIYVQEQTTPLVIQTYAREVFVTVAKKHKFWLFLQENLGWLWAPVVFILGLIWSVITKLKKKKDPWKLKRSRR